MDKERIIIVSGLPRSGTSMMMKMLVAGGLEALTDNIRSADEDNPRGYFELEKVKELDKDKSWLNDAGGRVIKVISALLKHLPRTIATRSSSCEEHARGAGVAAPDAYTSRRADRHDQRRQDGRGFAST